MDTWRKTQIQVASRWEYFLFLGWIGVRREVGKCDTQTDPHMYECYHASVLGMVAFIHVHFGYPLLLHTHAHTHTLMGLIRGLMSCRPACCVFCMRTCVCVCVCVLSGRPANTLSLGGSLIYKASNEVQQRRTSPRLIVCLFTFLLNPLPPYVTRVETVSSTSKKTKLTWQVKFPLHLISSFRSEAWSSDSKDMSNGDFIV